MSVAEAIESKVRDALPVAHLELENESHRHNVPANSETHFKLVLVSDLHLFTPEEWRAQGGDVADSPDCRGGDGQAKEKAR